MDYNFREIEQKWQKNWEEKQTNKVEVDQSKPKYYVLDMFPYPSGAGLHVGHPLGYIASDIFARYKRLKGFNVLHPMGYDAFGLPAEQYAIQTGQHPAITTENNIQRYRSQLKLIGLSYDWNRELRTSDPVYYKWTQWAFIQMFEHWFNNKTQKAEPIAKLIKEFESYGTAKIDASCTENLKFTAQEWLAFSEEKKQEVLLNYRLAYLADTMVNWCEKWGTVLANDEVKDGVSVRGGHPVVQKVMKQWLLRITAYAQRLLDGLDTVDWTDSLKEMQRNWIGRSEGAEVLFPLKGKDEKLLIFTTRPDTIYGATFMVLAPESDYTELVTTHEYSDLVQQYIEDTKKRTERERISDVKTVSGQFTGAYAINPFTRQEIPIFISDYVLAGYGTGAIMAVPAHDSRDYAFAKHFNLPIVQVVEGGDITKESYDAKDGKLMNSDILNGLDVKEAIPRIISEIESMRIGKKKVNFRLRDAIFSRQRYWGEPFPVYYKDSLPKMLPLDKLPLELPEIDKYQPTEKGEPPLGRAKNWKTADGFPLELCTMPGFAGSSAYYYRYMDPHNTNALVDKQVNAYWQDVDLYVGGTEHATGHLIYSRYWNKFLFDLGFVCKDEPYKKLINQGMILGRSNFVYRINNRKYAESLLWEMIKDGQLQAKFKQDYKIGNNLFNFYCEEKRLAIEVRNQSGMEKHYTEVINELNSKSIRFLVFAPEQIIEDNEKVKRQIVEALEGNVVNDFSGEMASKTIFVSKGLLKPEYAATEMHVDIHLVHNDILDVEAFKNWRAEFNNAEFILENDKYVCGWAVEKMSKSMYNVENPDQIVEKYGADTLRLYEMFLGPIEQSKPWDINGIEGVHKFLRRFWKMYHDDKNNFNVSEDEANASELKILHKTIKKIEDDIERFSFNTSVSAFMICVNELTELKCNKRQILQPLVVLLASFAPHIAEELWEKLGNQTTVTKAPFPVFEEKYTIENTFSYPVTFNGKKRFDAEMSLSLSAAEIQEAILADERTQKYLAGQTPKKIIVVPKKIINIVV